MSISSAPDLSTILDNFSLLSDWHDRYSYLIELGDLLPSLSDSELIDSNKVSGCVSQVWLVCESDSNGVYVFRGMSDSHIVRGLVMLVLAIFNGKTSSEIAATDERSIFSSIGLDEHLTPQRSNGLRSLVDRLRILSC